MLRVTKIIGKNEIFTYLSNPDIARVELTQRENKNMSNPNACKVFLHLKNPDVDCMEIIIGSCQKYIKSLSDDDNEYLYSVVQQQRSVGWISSTQIIKMIEISKRNNISLSISKNTLKLIEKYEKCNIDL